MLHVRAFSRLVGSCQLCPQQERHYALLLFKYGTVYRHIASEGKVATIILFRRVIAFTAVVANVVSSTVR